MSFRAQRYQHKIDRQCSECGRPALARVRGGPVKHIPDHDLCTACFRDMMNAERKHRAQVAIRP